MNKQQGFISIITVSIIMIIITLFVIGFSQVMQREQRQALDRQLSSQAVYAAETAVNDVYAQLQSGALVSIEEKPDCDVSSFPNGGRVNLGSSNEAAYTCVTFDQAPNYLEFSNGSINTQQSKIFPIQPKGNNNQVKVREITFKWNGALGIKNLSPSLDANCNFRLPPTASAGVPILRVDLVRLSLTGAIDRDAAINETTTFFLYPVNTCGDATNSRNYDTLIGTANKGTIIPVNCNSALAYACTYTLDAIGRGPADDGDKFYARVKSIYYDADLRVEGRSTQNPGLMEFLGAQVTVDATGKSNDVLRRIKVQLSNPMYPIPEYVVQGLDGVCKGLTIRPPTTITSGC
jgi:Tfp pilus assembly protein PilX